MIRTTITTASRSMKRAVCGTPGTMDRPKKLRTQYMANARIINTNKGSSLSGTLACLLLLLGRVGYVLQLLVVFHTHRDFLRVQTYLRQGVLHHFGGSSQ